MKTLLKGAVLAATLSLCVASAHAQIFVYQAVLDGPSESPANASPGTGFATVTINTTLNTMRVQASFSGLTGNTTASHIHAATATPFAGTAGVATQTPTFSGFPLGVTSGSYDNTFDMTLASSYNPTYVAAHGGTAAQAFTDLQTAIANGQAYLNIHTSTFPAGEIRGFLTTTAPEPGTFALLGLAAVPGITLLRRRHK
ncbi:MAG: CHRD domain-containing protein [Armatimonas sp.]